MWMVWFYLGTMVGKCSEKTAAKPARAEADQQDGIGGEDTQARKCHDLGRSPDTPINKEQ